MCRSGVRMVIRSARAFIVWEMLECVMARGDSYFSSVCGFSVGWGFGKCCGRARQCPGCWRRCVALSLRVWGVGVMFMVYFYSFCFLLLYRTGWVLCFYRPAGGSCVYGSSGSVRVGSEVGVVVRGRGVTSNTFTRDVNVRRSALSRVLGKQGGPDLSIVVGMRRGCGCMGLR